MDCLRANFKKNHILPGTTSSCDTLISQQHHSQLNLGCHPIAVPLQLQPSKHETTSLIPPIVTGKEYCPDFPS